MVKVIINRVEDGRFMSVILRMVDRHWEARNTKGQFVKAENAARARSKAFTPPPRPVEPLKPEVPGVERVTVGTGISVENRSSRGLRLSFTWSKVVPRNLVDEAKKEGEAWIRAKFGEEAGKLSPKYLKAWGLEEMQNFSGYNHEVRGWDPRDLGKSDRSWTVNGVEHKES